MKIFITGGTGFIGGRLTERLVAENNEVVLLLRDPQKGGYVKNKRVTVVKGDLSDTEALRKGMEACDWAFHLAAYTKPWSRDSSLVYKTNVLGTVNFLQTALEKGIKKAVLTSTGGTLSYSRDGKHVNESTNKDPEYHTMYEKTKAEAESVAINYSRNGLHVVIVNPTRVYGPGKLSKSNSLTRIIKLYLSGLWRIMPGNGESIGNYVYIDDVVEGHILAARSGRNGERYILGGENLSFAELFEITGRVAEVKRILIKIPYPFLEKVVRLIMIISNTSGIPPLITIDWLDKYRNDWIMSSYKAAEELNYKITPFSEGVKETIRWLKSKPDQNE